MIKYTYDVDLSQFTRQTRDKYAEEYQILNGLEGGRNVLFEYRTHTDAERARTCICGFAKRTGLKIRTHIVENTKVLVEVV